MVYVETFLSHVYRILEYFSYVKYNIYVIILSCIETRFCSISFSPLSFELRALRNIYSALAYPTIPVSKLSRFKKKQEEKRITVDEWVFNEHITLYIYQGRLYGLFQSQSLFVRTYYYIFSRYTCMFQFNPFM